MENLINELKIQIKEALNLEDLSVEEFDENAPLFGDDGIGLDSIDALEIIVLLEKKYGIRLANAAEGKTIFKNVATIAEYVEKNRKK
jgi:acyl carrier protein